MAYCGERRAKRAPEVTRRQRSSSPGDTPALASHFSRFSEFSGAAIDQFGLVGHVELSLREVGSLLEGDLSVNLPPARGKENSIRGSVKGYYSDDKLLLDWDSSWLDETIVLSFTVVSRGGTTEPVTSLEAKIEPRGLTMLFLLWPDSSNMRHVFKPPYWHRRGLMTTS
jgi:hypothetical protein